jgi:hypothetical protein
MKRMSWKVLLFVLALNFVLFHNLPASQYYSITDLGTGTVYDINNAGQILGSNGIWSSSQSWQVIDFGFTPSDMNDLGQVVGGQYLWSGGVVTDLGFNATDINDLGQISGYMSNYDSNSSLPIGPNALIWSADSGINYLGINNTATCINNLGQVAGGSEIMPTFVWSAQDSVKYIEHYGFTWVNDINDHGELVGSTWSTLYNVKDAYVPAYWSSTGEITLIRPPEYSAIDGGLLSINKYGVAVGYFGVTGSNGPEVFLLQNGTLTYLNEILSQDSGWVLSSAFGINDSGQIIGQGSFNGEVHSYLLSPAAPVPEPSTMFLLGTGIIVFFGFRKKKSM